MIFKRRTNPIILKYKYYASEFDTSKTKLVHSDMHYTNHMNTNLYDENDNLVGFLHAHNHYSKIGTKNHCCCTNVVKLFGYGDMLYNVFFISDNDYLSNTVNIIPHYKTNKLANKNVSLVLGPKTANAYTNERMFRLTIRTI